MDNFPRVKRVVIIAAIVAALAVSGIAAFYIVEMVTGGGRIAPPQKSASAVENDTARIMRLVMDTAWTRDGLPDQDYLKKNNPFGDSIVFCKEGWDRDWTVYFPGKPKLKFLSRKEICAMASHASGSFPHFLELVRFERSDSTYEIALSNTSVHRPSEEQAKRAAKRGVTINKDSCSFGFLSGGTLFLTFKKEGDTFKTKSMRVLMD